MVLQCTCGGGLFPAQIFINNLRGVQAFQFRKHDFDLWVGGDGLDMYQQLLGGFGSMRAIQQGYTGFR